MTRQGNQLTKIVVTSHSTADEVDYRANARHGLEILVDHKPPIANEVYVGCHYPGKQIRLSGHEMRQHDESGTCTGGLILRNEAGASEGSLWLLDHVRQPADL